MSLDLDFLDYVMEQLSFTDDLSYRKMFGGAGLYAGAVMFGLVAGDSFYLRTNEQTAQRFIDQGMGPFVPFADRPKYQMPYHEVPLGLIEQPSELESWVLEAIDLATKVKTRKKNRKI